MAQSVMPAVAGSQTNMGIMAANAPLPTNTPGGDPRPLKKATSRAHMAKPVTALTAGQTVTNTTNSEMAQTGGEIVIQRVTYSLAGQVTAVRVTGDPEPTNNGLFYLHTDHLGSVSAMSDDTGALVGEVTRYYPFGDYRTGGQSAITDRGFTGHHENRDIGLTYMNARYYVPYIYRMLSPDSIVPDPTDPQSFNRYSYALNNPVKYTDPSGHCVFAPPFDTAVCIALLALVLTGDTPAPAPGVANSEPVRNPSGGFGCTDTLLACYQHEDGMKIRDFNASNYVSKDEFEGLLGAVAEDLYRGITPGIWGV